MPSASLAQEFAVTVLVVAGALLAAALWRRERARWSVAAFAATAVLAGWLTVLWRVPVP